MPHVPDLRILPLLWAASATLMLAAALVLWPQQPLRRLSTWWRRAPRVLGGAGGALIGLGGWWLTQALRPEPLPSALISLTALLGALVVGVYVPGFPARAAAHRRERLLLQTVDLAGYLQLAVASSLGDAELLRIYTRRPQRQIADAQAVVEGALVEVERRRRGNVFGVLHNHAAATGSEALTACCAALLHGAQSSRRALGPTLAQQREQLLDTVVEACKQRAQRLELLLIGVSAAALAFGLLPCILFVMTGGASALDGFL